MGGEGFGGMLKDHGEEGEVDGGKREDVGGVGSLVVCRGGTGGRGGALRRGEGGYDRVSRPSSA